MHFIVKIIDSVDKKNLCIPIIIAVSENDMKTLTYEKLREIIWEKAKNLWASQNRSNAFESLVIETPIESIHELEEYQKICISIPGKGMNDLRNRALDGDLSAEDLISGFFNTTQLDERNQWKCEECKKSTCAMRKSYFQHLPEIVVFQIKRFSGVGRKSHRDNTPIAIPLQITLQDEEEQGIQKPYELRAISDHSGTLSFGHYTAYGKRGEKWYYFNDSSVSQNAGPTGQSAAAYLLFYEKPRPKPVENTPEEEPKAESDESNEKPKQNEVVGNTLEEPKVVNSEKEKSDESNPSEDPKIAVDKD